MDAGVPTGFFQDHAQVTIIRKVANVVTHPAQLERLPLHALAHHMLDLGENAPGEGGPKLVQILHQGVDGEHIHAIAHVDRDGQSIFAGQGWAAAPIERAILDIIVDQEGVVEQFDRDSGGQDTAHAAAKCQASGDT